MDAGTHELTRTVVECSDAWNPGRRRRRSARSLARAAGAALTVAAVATGVAGCTFGSLSLAAPTEPPATLVLAGPVTDPVARRANPREHQGHRDAVDRGQERVRPVRYGCDEGQ